MISSSHLVRPNDLDRKPSRDTAAAVLRACVRSKGGLGERTEFNEERTDFEDME